MNLFIFNTSPWTAIAGHIMMMVVNGLTCIWIINSAVSLLASLLSWRFFYAQMCDFPIYMTSECIYVFPPLWIFPHGVTLKMVFFLYTSYTIMCLRLLLAWHQQILATHFSKYLLNNNKLGWFSDTNSSLAD